MKKSLSNPVCSLFSVVFFLMTFLAWTPDAAAQDGVALYAQYCASCHRSLANSTKLGASATRIQTAIDNNVGGMGSLSFLTPGEVQAIADALAPQVCTDNDGDGYFAEGGTCGPQDCDDSDPAINPGAVEDCTDGIDNDCDGLLDSLDPDAVNCPTVCTDNDGDGYFAEGGTCGAQDCDDSDPAVNPGAVEDCTDGIDNDCDGLIDGADFDCGTIPIDGTALYAQHCASCHGILANSTKAGASAAGIQGAINGNVGGMGSLNFLTAEEIEAIAAALAQVPPPPIPTDGAGLYARHCASCHGSIDNFSEESSASKIREAIEENEGGMGFLSFLTREEIQLISDAIENPSPSPTPPEGPTLYAQNCAGCHGTLANSTKAGASAAGIQGAINGNVGGMGFLNFLTAEEIEAIAAALAQVPPPPTPTDGAGLYAQKCASCHGSLANSSKRGATLERLEAAISNNVGGMGYLGSLSTSELEAIIAALASPGPTAPTMAAFSFYPACGEVNVPVTISVSPAMVGEAFYKYWVNTTSYCETEGPNWEVIEDWTTEPTAMWTPVQPGRYTIIVWITDDLSSECTQIMGASYGVGEGNCIDPVGIQLVSGGGLVNEPVMITAIGGERNLQYKFWVNDSSYCDPDQSPNWVLLQDWNLANTATFTPPAEGVYTVVVWSAADPTNLCAGIGGMSYVVGDSLTPARPPTATDGAALYVQNCAACHGNLENSSKRGATVARLEAAIAANVGGMGYLDSLTAQELDAIAAALAPSTLNTSSPTGALDGPTLYAQYCASCHGSLTNSTKRGTTAEKIKSAISWWWTDMRLLDFLTDEEIQWIADALAQ